jgi:hypothetical protein
MPKRTDLQSILILGSRPIVIRQPTEFDCSGTKSGEPTAVEVGGLIPPARKPTR